MNKQNSLLSILVWVLSGALFATGAVLLSPRTFQENGKAPADQQEAPQAPIALDQR
jgi:hypothetical protein